MKKNKLYNGKSSNLSANYRHYRNRIAKKYNKPELKQIQLYDFRRFKGSKEYHLHCNLLYVKEVLGHKDTRSTERYFSLFNEQNITWITIAAENEEEIILPIPKNQWQKMARLEVQANYMEGIGFSDVAKMHKTILEKVNETRIIRIKGKNVDNLNLEKIGNMIKEANKKSSKINLRGLFKNIKK